MSLINDALKKAQRQRTEGSTPPAEATPPSDVQEPLHRVARRGKPAAFRAQLMLIGGGAAAVVALLVLGAVFLLRKDEPPAPMPKPEKIAAVQPTAPAPTASIPAAVVAPVVTLAATPATPPPAPQPVVATPAPVAAPVEVVAAAPTTPASTAPQFVLPPAVTDSTPAPASSPTVAAPVVSERPKPSTRMIGVIEHLRVGGIRVAGTESKVLMNDRVYRLNDVVDFELGIRLTGIEAKALTFEDARGAVHIRTF